MWTNTNATVQSVFSVLSYFTEKKCQTFHFAAKRTNVSSILCDSGHLLYRYPYGYIYTPAGLKAAGWNFSPPVEWSSGRNHPSQDPSVLQVLCWGLAAGQQGSLNPTFITLFSWLSLVLISLSSSSPSPPPIHPFPLPFFSLGSESHCVALGVLDSSAAWQENVINAKALAICSHSN